MLKVLAKSTQGYNYKYTELSEIVKEMAEQGLDYYQYTETDQTTLKDYMYTVIIKDGKESKPLRGCEIVTATLQGKSNPAQEMGSSITYARRYSLLMALGWATEDDDAKGLDGAKKVEPHKPIQTMKPGQDVSVDYVTQTQLEIISKSSEKLDKQTKIKLMKEFKVNKIAELTKAQADKFIERINDINKAQEVKNG